MKLYAFTTPDIPKNAGYLKIGETNGSVDKRIKEQGHTLNTPTSKVWEDAVLTDRSRIDKRIHQYLREQGFDNPKYPDTGEYTELVKCTVDDLKKAFEIIKQQIYDEEKLREAVGNQFYLEIRNWYYWTAKTGDDPYSVAEPEYTLRLIVRLLFVFFLIEKGLVPKELIDENWVKENLKENEEYRYYNAVLRNLFFYSLNAPQNQRGELEHKKLAKNLTKLKDIFKQIPFLNGGLFNEHPGDDFAISNDHFFSELQTRHIKELGGDYKVEGIIRLLSHYQFKTELDLIDAAEYTKTIDPEFIGKVFESLLACIDADSKESRRKITGSFYTPREIVDYMVNESLDEYLKTNDDLLNVKILDPACGSGAFPCGVMNEIMQRIDPKKKLSQIERYHKKLGILRNVIYGVDIQPMAVQITILRLFLSLIQEIVPDKKKDNYGIEPLPNLETKFVCANTLIGLQQEKQQKLVSLVVKNTIKSLLNNRNRYLMSHDKTEQQHLRQEDETLRETLSIALEDSGFLSHNNALRLAQWNPYDQTKSAEFFDPPWMFGIENFDIVIGNPPYIESRSASVSKELKKQYQEQVKKEFGSPSQYITQGSDLLIYFFPRSMTLLSEHGTGMLIVQNGWLSTDYGMKASQFLMKTLQYVKISDSPFRHFDRASANINTVIVKFKKQSKEKKICFDIMEDRGTHIVTKNEKSFALKNSILSDMKWGMIMSAENDIFSVLKTIIEKGQAINQSFYSIGQGINVSQNAFIPKNEESKFSQKENIINAVFKEYQYVYSGFDYFLYHSFKPNDSDISVLKTICAEEFGTGKSFTRKYPAVIMPRGIGALHFAGLLNEKALSNSFVDVYMQTEDEEKKLNIWLFCNSNLFFLYREISGRKNLGGGLLKSEAADIKLLPLYFPIANKKSILSLLKEMGTPVNLRDRLNTAVQKKIDKLVCSYFEISSELQSKITNELLRLFEFRYNKATN